MDDLETNPTAGTPGPEVATDDPPGVGIDTEVDAEPAEGDEALQAAEDELEEVEIDGKLWSVPKALAAERLMHKDYTKKTQEVASERTALQSRSAAIEAREQRFQQDTEAHGANLRDISQLMSLADQAKAYDELDWAAIEQQDAENARNGTPTNHLSRLRWERIDIRDRAQALAGQLQAKHAERQSNAERELATRRDQAQTVFAREIPGWTGIKQSLEDFAIAQGVTAQRFRDTTDPTMMKLLHKAYRWDQYETKQRGAIRSATPQRPTAAPVPQVAARRTPATGPSDKDSMDDWVRKEKARMKAVEARKRA